MPWLVSRSSSKFSRPPKLQMLGITSWDLMPQMSGPGGTWSQTCLSFLATGSNDKHDKTRHHGGMTLRTVRVSHPGRKAGKIRRPPGDAPPMGACSQQPNHSQLREAFSLHPPYQTVGTASRDRALSRRPLRPSSLVSLGQPRCAKCLAGQ